MIGIYKITSPNNKVYIGQSIDIERRFKKYKNNCRTQIKLKRSFNKYGVESHKFEVIEECEISELNNRERYWQEYYDVLNNGLNCRLTETNDKSGKLSEETKLKLSKSKIGIPSPMKGIKFSDERKEQMRQIMIGKMKGDKNPMYGRKHSNTTKEKISKSKKGKPLTDAQIKHHKNLIGKKYSDEINKKKASNNKIVIDLNTGVFYESIAEASKYYNYNLGTLRHYLSGSRKNKTNLLAI